MTSAPTFNLMSAQLEALNALLRIVRHSTSETQVRLACTAILRFTPKKHEPAAAAQPAAPAAKPAPANTPNRQPPPASAVVVNRASAHRVLQPVPDDRPSTTHRTTRASNAIRLCTAAPFNAAALLASAGCPPRATSPPSPRAA